MRKIVFEGSCFQDFVEWATIDKKLYLRVVDLVMDIVRQPFSGIGKPEPLKHDLKGYWSRRINETHRLVYKVNDVAVVIVSCKYHY
ncbi:MAG: Txe/YoeB family addiction module toxin [Nitrospirae bacterium]|nr:Txe/YoeB family addiction module toxin [Nitrospirota bacterium]MBI3358495.1 Txe/YoeB family addiction module toxin [Candidatus Troglogloeales bacterium]